ncbi:hypothetical protein CEUSTIGMA_g6222.t1 [Chlamydomonas eustigma]|uniref:Uncharacterized protein n=1 Tax=Chlamydomonas eustigma TaxID=1157962 RepID=A0A250X6U5_9CHLO|nr:hypothetical protein CEUSTIGMA_g6222.t1 [Chlamydomonas eustigma]|eukprot:GAX78785.1 hypothetical protein CEUSTIGMA_g6222.t1 [Chlamydomonas eustigma]
MKVLGAILRGLEARLYRRIRLLFIQYLKETGLYEQVWRRGDPAHYFLHIQEARNRKRQLGGARNPTLGEIAEHLPCDGPPACHRALKEYTVPASDCRKALIGQSGVMLEAGWQPSLPPGTLLGSYEGCHMSGEHFDEYSKEIPVCYQDTYTSVLLPEYQACPEAAELVKNERVRDPCWWVDVNKYGMDIRRQPFSQNFMRSISFSVSEEEHCIIRDSSDVVVIAFPRSATGSCLLSLINDPVDQLWSTLRLDHVIIQHLQQSRMIAPLVADGQNARM